MSVLPDALIGHTGFVGSTLDRSGWPFQARFNSSTVGQMAGGRFGTVVCAGVSAVKWLANREPEADWAGIQKLIQPLLTITAERFVLVSTIDVYPNPVGVTEADAPPPNSQAYGRHRLQLEQTLAEHFPRLQIVRLPALFGHGLKKNAVFDLLTDNQVDRINPAGRFQWYPVRRLADDLRRVLASDVALLNIATEPLVMEDIASRFFPGVALGPPDTSAPAYDMHTQYANLLDGVGDYHMTAAAVMAELDRYIEEAHRAGTP